MCIRDSFENNALVEVSSQGESRRSSGTSSRDPSTISGSTIPDPLTRYRREFAMSRTAVTSPALTPPVGPFSQAIEVGGFLYFSGQVGQDAATGKLVEGGILAE